MGLRDSATKAAARAVGIAIATSGLSTCHDGGGIVVDPVPGPLVCSDVASGQLLVPAATKSGDAVTASIKTFGVFASWKITRVGDVVGATIAAITLPKTPRDSLVVTMQLATPATSRVDFTVEGQLTGFQNETCNVQRTFHVTIGPGTGGVQISEMNLDQLPLRARQPAEIAILGRLGRTVSLEARTLYQGPHSVTWEVTGGELDTTMERATSWTLPGVPGIYQVELLLDYGPDGVAFDSLMLEVRV